MKTVIFEGTLRRLRYQLLPHGETNHIQCLCGSLFDVWIDLRHNSPTYLEVEPTILHANDLLFLLEEIAHGFQTLEDTARLAYWMGTPFHPKSARDIRWNDLFFSIEWSLLSPLVSERDSQYPDFHLTPVFI